MKTELLKRFHKDKKKVSVGRGGKRGKTSGRGTKGQKARAGHKIRPEIRDMIKRLPKLRGHGKNSNQSIQTKPIAVQVAQLESAFKAGETVTRAAIFEKGLVRVTSSNTPQVKILSGGEITKKLTIVGCMVSASAKAKIEKAGGTIGQ
jgi:large subunit ribosomal protein L15